MRALALMVVLLVFLASSTPAVADVRDPGKVNKILMYGTFETPDLEPGSHGVISFNLTNPYNMSMTNVVLNASIYEYAEQGVSMKLDSSWQWEHPRFAGATGNGREMVFQFGSLPVNYSNKVSLTVLTSVDMPHGGVFNQGAYFVRFWLTFTLGTDNAKMASPGYWTKEQFQYSTEEGDMCPPGNCIGQVNLSRLGNIDGILPDTAFGVKDRIPQWPFYAMIVGAGFFMLLAFLFYAEENPSAFPRTARSFSRFKGRMARIFRPRKGLKSGKGLGKG